MATLLVDKLGELEGVEVIARPRINQGLVRFLDSEGNHDERTDEVIDAIVSEGTAWFGGVTHRGMRVMRISVCNHRTQESDIDRTVDAVSRILTTAI
ncbi:MAG: hypothetical protein JKY56_04665 [Kofleriaceae bacterium]|nr:hypothetical protein [Kofleriaceae bacterium]